MKKEITIKIDYIEKGEEKEKSVTIGFISNRVIRDYNKLRERLNNVLSVYDDIKKLTNKTAEIIAAKDKGFLAKIKEAKVLTAEIAGKQKILKDTNEDNVNEDMFELIHRIFTDNGCRDDELLEYSFWDEKTTRSMPWVFLNKAVMKDIEPGKKKSTILTNPS